jgi:hypothetical protein
MGEGEKTDAVNSITDGAGARSRLGRRFAARQRVGFKGAVLHGVMAGGSWLAGSSGQGAVGVAEWWPGGDRLECVARPGRSAAVR